jgi:hypothetical protein
MRSFTHKAFVSTEASKARDRAGFGLTHRKEIFIAETFVRKALHLRPSREIEMPSTRNEPTRRGASGALRQTSGAGNDPHQGVLA